MSDDRSDLLAELLLAGLAHLRAGRAVDAADALRSLLLDPEFATATDVDDVKARAYGLYAQALLGAGAPTEAARACDDALRLARTLGDEAGLTELRALQAEIRDGVTTAAKARAAEAHAARLAGLTLEQILVGLASPAERADALVKKALADLDHGRPGDAEVAARRALTEAIAAERVTEEVHARLALARAARHEASAQLLAAWRRAERADEFNLVGAVARTAELLGVRLPTLVGPSGEA